jgi:hypothetical protein
MLHWRRLPSPATVASCPALASLVFLLLAAFTSPAQDTPAKESPVGGLIKTVKELVGMEETNKTVVLFDGRNLNQFYSWIEKQGTFVDPNSVFSVQDGMLRISGENLGYLATRAQFSDYRLLLEYKWGTNIWFRKDKPRNSGVFVHCTGLDGPWMKSIECQIEPGSTGEIVLQGGASLSVRGETKLRPWNSFTRSVDREVEFPTGKWNTLEIVCEGGRVRVKVNGHLTNEGQDAYPNRGKIFLQSNGAEIFFRRIDLVPITFTNAPSPSVPPPAAKPAAPEK